MAVIAAAVLVTVGATGVLVCVGVRVIVGVRVGPAGWVGVRVTAGDVEEAVRIGCGVVPLFEKVRDQTGAVTPTLYNFTVKSLPLTSTDAKAVDVPITS